MRTDRSITTELLEMGKKLTGYEEIRAEQIKQHPLNKELSQVRHNYMVGRAARIARKCIDHGGTAEEVETVLIYMMLCIDAKKYEVDTQQYYIDNIAMLDRKYRLA